MSTVQIELGRREVIQRNFNSGTDTESRVTRPPKSTLELTTVYFSLATVGFGAVGAVANAFDLLNVDAIDRLTFVRYYLAPIVLTQDVFKFAVPDVAESWYLGVEVKPEWASSALWRYSALSGATACLVYVAYPNPLMTKFFWFYHVLTFAFMGCYVSLNKFHSHPLHVSTSFLYAVTFLGFWLSTNSEL